MVAAVDPLLLIKEMDISAEDKMTSVYGERIPVLRRSDSGAELDWPYGAEQLIRFLKEP